MGSVLILAKSLSSENVNKELLLVSKWDYWIFLHSMFCCVVVLLFGVTVLLIEFSLYTTTCSFFHDVYHPGRAGWSTAVHIFPLNSYNVFAFFHPSNFPSMLLHSLLPSLLLLFLVMFIIPSYCTSFLSFDSPIVCHLLPPFFLYILCSCLSSSLLPPLYFAFFPNFFPPFLDVTIFQYICFVHSPYTDSSSFALFTPSIFFFLLSSTLMDCLLPSILPPFCPSLFPSCIVYQL